MQPGFFDCLDRLDATKPDAEVSFEPVDDPATGLDAEAEIAAFVDRPDRAADSEDDRPAKPAIRSIAARQNTPLGDLMGFYRGSR